MPLTLSGSNGVAGVDGSAGTPALQGSDSNTGIAFGADTIIGSTGGSERFRVDSSGRLLVGATTSLSVDGFGSNLQLEATTFAASQSIVRHGGTAAIRLGRSGGSSIGSTTIVASGNELGALRFVGADGVDFDSIAGQITCEVDGTPGSNDMPGRLIFSTTADSASSPTERMRITNAGKVLINTTAPQQSISTAALHFDGANYWGLEFRDTASVAATPVAFFRGTTQVGSIGTNAGATTYATSSDYRLKENIVFLENATARLKQLPVCRFNFIGHPERIVDGFIAHEVQPVVPEAIIGEKDAVDEDGNPVYQGIDQSKLVPLLTAALQEAIAKIESLETRLAALEVT